LLEKLWQQYHAILEAEEMNSPQMLKEILDSAARVGFLVFEDDSYRLLTAVHRYLDLFEELAQADRSDQLQAEDLEEDLL
jgi:DNA-binding transcriptional MocR family regulator